VSVYAIVSREAAPDVARVLHEMGLADAPVAAVGKGQGPAALEEAARVPADVLILDIATGPGLGKAVIRYRLARPDTRVILLALARQPGDPEVAQVVQAGIYDIVTSLEDLAAALDGPATDFARAALWLDPTLAPEAQAQAREREVIVQKVPISTRPVLLAVLAAAPGAGATTVAAAVAGFLARQGYRTCLVAADATRDLELVSGVEPGKEPRRWVPGLDFHAGDFRDVLVLGRYEYVVADMGRPAFQEAAALPADLTLLVLPPPHRIDRVLDWLEGAAYRQPIPRARYVVLGRFRNLEGLQKVWGAVFGPSKPDRQPLPVYALPLPRPDDHARAWPPGYSLSNPEFDAALAQLLAPVLPETPRRGRVFLTAARNLAWPAALALAGLAAWLARAEIAAALRRLFAF